jgi:2'-hydroxyisoflavone reductase
MAIETVGRIDIQSTSHPSIALAMNRRDAIKFTAAALSLAANRSVLAAKPLRLLILGGTGFIGPHFVETLQAHGHTLTLFNRGKRNASLFPQIETLIGDRNGALDALRGRDWDIAIDNSGYVPRHVRQSAELLKEHVKRYIFVSSISAYASLAKPGITEDDATATLPDPTVEQVTDETYGGLKALCEQAVEQTFGARATILRPTYIVGPGDPTDRFTYWPVRAARGGEMLAPGTPNDPIQFIDVRDLAEFTRACVEQDIPGRFNVCNEPRKVSIGELLQTSKRIAKADTQFRWAEAAFLEANKLLESGEIPIWSPTQGEYAGAALVSPARAIAKGLRFRDLETTVTDTLAWHRTRPAEQQQKLKAGLAPERESQLLAKLKA